MQGVALHAFRLKYRFQQQAFNILVRGGCGFAVPPDHHQESNQLFLACFFPRISAWWCLAKTSRGTTHFTRTLLQRDEGNMKGLFPQECSFSFVNSPFPHKQRSRRQQIKVSSTLPLYSTNTLHYYAISPNHSQKGTINDNDTHQTIHPHNITSTQSEPRTTRNIPAKSHAKGTECLAPS